ncbi:NB-ARC domain-containing protein [Streptomyces sp. YGL11-2]|uniref:NB-ARC domain-containing protein n=1 Tax=Streptomyces sp. YGL11-2 TaxID=3414028 RepID=UPI003CEB6FA3
MSDPAIRILADQGAGATVRTPDYRQYELPEPAMPDSAGERQDLYRTLVASRRVLVVIDNVVEAEDLRYLIPTGGRCAVLVTTQAANLTVEGALRVPLGPLAPEEARDLLFSGLPPGRLDGQDQQTDEVPQLCGGLPLAIRSVGTLLVSRPHWSMAHVRDALTVEEKWLTRAGIPGHNIVGAFDAAYARLPEHMRRALLALAAFDVGMLTPSIAAVLVGCSVPKAGEPLDELADRCLLAPTWSDRSCSWAYAVHDLLRAHLRAHMAPADFEAVLVRALTSWHPLAEGTADDERGGRIPVDRARRDSCDDR